MSLPHRLLPPSQRDEDIFQVDLLCIATFLLLALLNLKEDCLSQNLSFLFRSEHFGSNLTEIILLIGSTP
jgi:hypothetical protein